MALQTRSIHQDIWLTIPINLMLGKTLSLQDFCINACSTQLGIKPRWFEIRKTTGRPVVAPDVQFEGLTILEHAAGWFNRRGQAHIAHVTWCTKAGLDPATEPPIIDPEGGMYQRAGFFRAKEIGFDGSELVSFLDVCNVTHGFRQGISSARCEPSPPSATTTIVHKIARSRRDGLWVAIDEAIKRSSNPSDTAEVWVHMLDLANAEFQPLLAVVDGRIKHTGGRSTFSKDALDKRLHPEKRKTPANRR